MEIGPEKLKDDDSGECLTDYVPDHFAKIQQLGKMAMKSPFRKSLLHCCELHSQDDKLFSDSSLWNFSE
jgi:hypothetical protein